METIYKTKAFQINVINTSNARYGNRSFGKEKAEFSQQCQLES